MKILICAPPIGVSGGISRWIENILDGNIRLKNYNLVHFPMRRSFYVEGLNRISRFYWGIKDYYYIFQNLKNHVKSEITNYSLIHINSSASISLTKDIIICLWLRTHKIPAVVHFHFGRIPILCEKKTWEYFLIKILSKICNDIIVIDRASEKALIKHGFRNVNLIYNPLPNFLKNTETDFLKRDKNEILFVGEVLESKGIFDLILALENLDIKLTIVGHFEETIKLRLLELSSRNNISVNFTGRLNFEELKNYYSRCRIFILPSHTEGFPNVIIEAMAFGCPIIATKVGAIPQILQIENNQYCGILIEPKDKEHLRHSIQKLLSDDNYAKFLGKNAVTKVNNEYSEEKIMNDLYKFWNKYEKK